jgi:error-prone DNA polymerase
MSAYVELHAHSAFSFLDGASTPTELAARAAHFDYPAFALTDHDGVWGSMEFAVACRDLGLRPITGAELTLEGGEHLTLLVETQAGYRNLCRLLTEAHSHTREGSQRSAGQPWVVLEQVEAHSEGLLCLSGCARDGLLAGAWEREAAPAGMALGRRLAEAFGRNDFRVELQRPFWRRDRARNRWLAGVPSGSASPASRPATSTATTPAAPASRTPSSRSGWGPRSRPPSPGAGETRARS